MDGSSVEKLLKQKKEAKKEIAKKLSFKAVRPLLAIVLDNELAKDDEDLLKELLGAIENLDVEAVILADSNLDAISFAHCTIIPYSQRSRTDMLQAADMAACFSFNDVEEMMLNGAVPIAVKRPELKNYEPCHETGNSFICTKDNIWGFFEALVRALETFKLPYDWKNIVREGVASVKN